MHRQTTNVYRSLRYSARQVPEKDLEEEIANATYHPSKHSLATLGLLKSPYFVSLLCDQ